MMPMNKVINRDIAIFISRSEYTIVQSKYIIYVILFIWEWDLHR